MHATRIYNKVVRSCFLFFAGRRVFAPRPPKVENMEVSSTGFVPHPARPSHAGDVKPGLWKFYVSCPANSVAASTHARTQHAHTHARTHRTRGTAGWTSDRREGSAHDSARATASTVGRASERGCTSFVVRQYGRMDAWVK